MTRQIIDAELEVFKPDNQSDDPDTTIPRGDLDKVSINSRIQDLIDTGRITIDNDDGQYTGAVTSGDRLRWWTRLEGEDSLTHRWTGLVRPVTYDQTGPSTGSMELRVDDFVFGVLDIRTVVDAFDGDPISGEHDAALNRILRVNAPEIDQSQIDPITTEVDITWNGKSLLEAVKELADRANAVAAMDDTSLVFERIRDVSADWGLTSADKGLHSVEENDDNLANEVRVMGGTGVQVDAEQTTHDATETVTEASRLTTQLRTRKSEVTQIEVWTGATNSTENVAVRLQADDGGAPKDPSSRESDIARKSLSGEFLADDDWTTFKLPDHKLPDRDPWLLIESEGSDGQPIGVDASSGDPAFRAYYPYPLDTILDDQTSIEEYRRRETTTRKDTLDSRRQTIQVAKSQIRHSKDPERTIQFPAESVRAHNLQPGDAIYVDEPDERFVGTAIVVEKRDSFNGVQLTTDIIAQDASTI